MTNEVANRKLLSSGTHRALTVLVLTISCSLNPATAQDSPSQRRLSTRQAPERPLDQLRVMLQRQQLNNPRQLPSAQQIQKSLNLSDEQFRMLQDALKRTGVLPEQLPSPIAGTKPPPPEDTLSNLQRLSRELLPVPDQSSPTTWPVPQRAPGGSTAPEPGQTQSAAGDSPAPSSRPRSRPNDRSPRRPRSERQAGTQAPPGAGAWSNRERASPASRSELPRPADTRGADGPSFDLSQELSNRGLQKTLRRLVRDVRTKVQQESGAGDSGAASGNSTWNRALFNVLDTVREDVVDTVRESRQQNRSRQSATRQAQTQRQRDTGRNSRNDSKMNSPANSQAASSRSAQDATPGLLNNPTFPTPTASRSTTSQLILILAGLGLAALAVLRSARRQTLAQNQQRGRALRAVKPGSIRSREDIIRAFHWLTHLQAPEAADWWNHLQAGESLARQTHQQQESLQRLLQLYEMARYQPADRAMEPDQIQQARAALAGCLS